MDSANRSAVVLMVLALAAGLVGCEPAAERESGAEAAVDTARILSTLDSVRSAFEAAYSEGEFDRVVAHVHPEMIYSPAGHPPIRGRDSVLAYDRRNFPEGATLELEPIETRVLGPNWAYDIGTSRVSYTPEGAEEEQTVEGSYLVVLRKTAEGWQVFREVAGSNEAR